MRCPNCGQELRPNDKFCANCGAPAPLDIAPDPYGDPYGDASPQRPPLPPTFDNQPYFRQATAPPRSFVTQAVIALVLYWFGWIPGLIANLFFWNEAKTVERATGRTPDGMGCLVALLIVFGILPVLGFCAIIVAAMG